MRYRIALCLTLAGAAAIGTCSTATFDDLSEGYHAMSFTDGGITFSDNDNRAQGPQPSFFTIEDGSGESSLIDAGFSIPNVLSTTGYSPGPSAGFGVAGSFWMTTGHESTSASLDFFGFTGDSIGNSVSLEAYSNGVLVATDVLPIVGRYPDVNKYHLSIEGVSFDTLRFNALGPKDNGAVFGVFDNVHIESVPEPTTMLGLALGAGALVRRRRRNPSTCPSSANSGRG